jgi:PST family polysaccharide transporter
LPAAIGIGLTAEYFVPLLLGPKWIGAVPVIEFLVVSGGLQALSSHVRPVYLAMNRPNLGAYAAIGRTIVYVPALILALLYYGIEGAAVAHAAGSVAILLCSLYLMHKLLGLTLRDIWATCWRPLTGCALMTLTVGAAKWLAPAANNAPMALIFLLAMAVAIGIVTYIGSVLLLWLLCSKPAVSAESYLLTYLARGRSEAGKISLGSRT